MDIKNFSKNYLDETKKILDTIEEDLLNKVEEIAILLEGAKNKKNRIFVMGNGGSGSTASHFAEDLSKGTIAGDSLRFKAISLADSIPTILAWANDSSYEDIFVEQLKNLMEPGDIVIGISGSGNSMNVIKAIEYANSNAGITVGFSGYDGGKLIKSAKINIHVPSFNMQRVEDIHMMVFHLLMSLLMEKEKNMNILVTGNKGYIGTVLTKMLLDKGYKVTGFDAGYYDGCQFSDSDLGIKQIKKDIRDASKEDLEGIDAIIHLAGLSNDHISVFKPEMTYDINFEATVRLANLAKTAGIKRFIFASSCSIYGIAGSEPVREDSPLNPVTPYAISKIKAEEALSKIADKDFSPVYLRPSTAYGVSPMLRCDLVVNNLTGWAYTTGKIKIMSDGTPWRPAIHVEDFARGFIACLEAPTELVHNQAFNLGENKENYQIKSIGDAIKKIMPNCEIEYTGEHGSDSRTYKVNFDKINTTLKDYFHPTWTLEAGVKQLYEAFKANNLTCEDFTGEKYNRLGRIKSLIEKNKIDQNLLWQ